MLKDIVHLHRKDLENLKQYREKYLKLVKILETELELIEGIEKLGGKMLPDHKSLKEGLRKIIEEKNCTPEGCLFPSIQVDN